MAAASIQTSLPLSFSLSNPRRKLPSSSLSSSLPLSEARNLSSVNSPFLSISIPNLSRARVVSGQIKGPIPRRYLGDDYVVKKVTAKQVHKLVKADRKLPLIIGFYATWCGPCVHMAQELEMLAVEYEDRAIVVKVDTDEEYEFARDMQVRGLPTLYFISPNPKKNAIRTEGLIPSVLIHDIIDNEM
ncbi:thioredoxin-like protein CITRX, chloroplastic [Carex rostrata]